MTEPTFSIVVATSGRPTLNRTLSSIAPQLEPGDEIIVVCDDTGDAGDTPRNDAMPRARGSHLAFMDDDDVYARDALEKMRRFAREHPGRIGLFKMRHVVGTTHWVENQPVLRYGNISTQIIVVPNVPGKLGHWHELPRPGGGNYAGDYIFVKETAELQGDPVFVDEVIVYVRPPKTALGRLWVPARYRVRLRTRLRELLERLARK